MTDKKDNKKRRKDKKSRKPPVDDEEEEEEEFDQMDYFQKMMENFAKNMGPEFYKMMNEVMRRFDPTMKDMTPEELQKLMKENMKNFRIMPLGKNGMLNFEPFNTTKSQNQQEPTNAEEREPLVDIMEEDEEIIVVAEIPGCAKENIDLDTTDTTLSITACDEEDVRKYKTTVDLPAKINPNHARARYRNGILEVKLEKAKKKGKKISVE